MDQKKIYSGNGRYLFLLLAATLLLTALDQWTKLLAVRFLKDKSPVVLIKGVFELTYLENRGAAFGLFQNQRIPFLVLTVFVMAGIFYVYVRIPKCRRFLPVRIISAGLLSGAAGNMIDRLFHGYVVDFFYFRLIDFPVFNVADIYVTVSMAVLVIVWIFYYKEEEFDFLFGRKDDQAGG